MPASAPTHVTLWKAARNAIAARVGDDCAAFGAPPDGKISRPKAALAAIPKLLRVIEGLMVSIPGELLVLGTR